MVDKELEWIGNIEETVTDVGDDKAINTVLVDENGPIGVVANKLQVDGTLTLDGVLSKDTDSVDVAKMSKGSRTVAHNAITATATSNEVDCRGFNSVLLDVDLSAANNWTFKIQGCTVSGGTFKDCYEQANTGTMTLMSYQTNASKIFVFKGVPDYIKVVATEDADGATCTVAVQPLNL